MSVISSRRLRSLRRRVGEVGPGGLLLLARAFLWLAAARLALIVVPVRRVIAWKQRLMRPASHPLAQVQQREAAERVRWAVLVVARYSPVEFVCFPQCLAASQLLRGYGLPTRLHYGVARDASSLITHTWLELDGFIVIGGEVADGYSTLAVYEDLESATNP